MKNFRTIDLPKIVDPRGNLTVAEQMKNVPFDIARVYWTYDVPSGERRGGHAHRTCEEIVIAVSGSFDVEVFDGTSDIPSESSLSRIIYRYRRMAHIGGFLQWRCLLGARLGTV